MAQAPLVNIIQQLLKPFLGDDVHWEVVVSPDPELGDYAVAMFAVAKQQGVAPADLATKVAGQLTAELAADSPIERVVATGPYVNFFIKPAAAVAEAISSIAVKPTPTGRKVVVEFFNPNPLKVFHVGHLLNAALGESIRRLFAAQGHEAIGCSYSGDVGVHVAKWLWYYQHRYQGAKIADVPAAEFLEWAGAVYVDACAAVAADAELEAVVAEYNRLIDQQDPTVMADWQAATERSYQALAAAATDLGCQLDYTFKESETAGPGKAYIQTQIDAGHVIQDQGAWVINLEDEKLGVFILLKSDGTALYQTKDFGLIELKRQRIGVVDESLVVVGGEQQYYFRQLRAAMARLNYPGWATQQAVHHGIVSLKEGKMASRTGNIISYSAARDRAVTKVREIMAERNPDLANADEVARRVGIGAIKFSMLSGDRLRNQVFDWDQALSFEGNSGPYVQYTYARIQTLKKKAGGMVAADPTLLVDQAEKELALLITRLPAVATAAAAALQPYLVAQYLLALAGAFNRFYHACRVIDPTDPGLTAARLALADAVGQTIQRGLWMLGIETVDEM